MFTFIKKKLSRYWFYLSILLLILAIFPSFNQLIKKGYFFMQDDLQAFRLHQMDKCISDFQIPCRWVPDAGYGYGYPQFIFYAPGVYYIGETLHLIGFQIIDSVKIMFILGYVLSAIAMYLLVNEFMGKLPAFTASILYTFAPYKALEVYVRGALSEFWSFVLFPLLLLFSYKLIKTGKTNYTLLLSLVMAIFFIIHNLIPIIFTPILAIWIIFWLKAEGKFFKTGLIKSIFFAIFLGFGLASFFLLPVLFERGFVHSESLLGGYFDYRQHFVSLKKLFLDFSWGYGSSGFPNEIINLSAGFTHVLAALFAFIFSIYNFKKNKVMARLGIILFAVTMFILFMVHRRSSFIWEIIPFLKWLQFPWRFLTISTFLLSFLSAIAIFLSGKYRYILAFVLCFASFIIYRGFYTPRDWYQISDKDKFEGKLWEKQQTISIFDYLPIYAEFPPVKEAPDLPEILEGDSSIRSYIKKSDKQFGEVVSDTDTLLRLPLYDFPGMRVKVNGQKVIHWNNDCRLQDFCLGLITFKIGTGSNKIEVELTDSPVRRFANYITIFSLVVFVFFYVNERKNPKISKE